MLYCKTLRKYSQTKEITGNMLITLISQYFTRYEMPTSCAVFGCKSGYKNHHYNGSISIYLFPSDEDERQPWIDALPNRDFKWTKYKGV